MLSRMMQYIQPRHIGLLALCGLAFLYLALFRYDSYGLEEGAARALLLNWSITDQVTNATPLFGIPDLRAIMFMFLNIHWAGSLPAAKVFTMLMLFATALMLYRWSELKYGSESSVMATALLLISPLAVMQVDSIAPGVFLLFCFSSAFWLDRMYRGAARTVAGSFFMLIVMSAFAVSLHPMGLALPLALLWGWIFEGELKEKRRNMLIGLVASTAVILLARMGWPGLELATDPLALLGYVLTGTPLLQAEAPTGYGIIVGTLLLFVMVVYGYRRAIEPLSLMLILATLLGLFWTDFSWALLAETTLLFLGLPMLIAVHRRTGIQGLIGQRGLVLLLVVLCASLFTSAGKHYRIANHLGLKSDVDQVIASAAAIAADHQQDFLIASQWPARTLLATKRDVLPLPPKRVLDDREHFMDRISGITHFMFDPKATENKDISRVAVSLGHAMETIELLPGGVILKVNHQNGGSSHPS